MVRYIVSTEDQTFMGLPSIAGPKFMVIDNNAPPKVLFEGSETFCKHMAFLLNFAARESEKKE